MKRKKLGDKLKDAGAPVDSYKLNASADAGPGEEVTRGQLVATINQLDPKVKPGDGYFETALFMLAALYVGHDLEKLEQLTGVSRDYIEPRAERLRRAGV